MNTDSETRTQNIGSLKKRIIEKKIKVGVIGLGYVGLPLAVEFARAGIEVLGIDSDSGKVKSINNGLNYIGDVDSRELTEFTNSGKLKAEDDYSFAGTCDALFICVPTPFTPNKAPDISCIINSAENISKYLRKDQIIVLRSTTFPNTTEGYVQPILEKTGLKAGKDFFLAFSPERIDPGNKRFKINNIPTVVGGVDDASTELAALVIKHSVGEVVKVSNPKVAEMEKLLENIFRSVNIALVNELAQLCDRMGGINIWEVVDAAATKPFGFMPFYPGPGLGGHCIPIDPFYLTWKAREYGQPTRFIELAGEINTAMPAHVVNRTAEALNASRKPMNGSRVLVFGLAYKPDVDDDRESPSYVVMDLLKARGADVAYYDPYVPVIRLTREHPHWAGTRSVGWNRETLQKFDAVIIATNHQAVNYSELADWTLCIVDTRNAMAGVRTKPGQVWKA